MWPSVKTSILAFLTFHLLPLSAQHLQVLSTTVIVGRSSGTPAYLDTVNVCSNFNLIVGMLIERDNFNFPDSVNIQHWYNSDSGLVQLDNIVINNLVSDSYSQTASVLGGRVDIPSDLDSGIHRFIFSARDNEQFLGDSIKWPVSQRFVSWTDFNVGYKGVTYSQIYPPVGFPNPNDPPNTVYQETIPYKFNQNSVIVRPDILYDWVGTFPYYLGAGPLFQRSIHVNPNNTSTWLRGDYFDDSLMVVITDETFLEQSGEIHLDSLTMNTYPRVNNFMTGKNSMQWTNDSIGTYGMTIHIKAFTAGQLNFHQAVFHSYQVVWNIGIDEVSSIKHLMVYPNPTTDQITVIGTTQHYTLKVIDQGGKIIHNDEVTESDVLIDTQYWSSGVYTIQALDEHGVISHSVKVIRN
jgi:hypothetical protein